MVKAQEILKPFPLTQDILLQCKSSNVIRQAIHFKLEQNKFQDISWLLKGYITLIYKQVKKLNEDLITMSSFKFKNENKENNV